VPGEDFNQPTWDFDPRPTYYYYAEDDTKRIPTRQHNKQWQHKAYADDYFFDH
jgi:hypothetical protein